MKKHVYGAVCVECGAHLDPNKQCDCEKQRAEQQQMKRISNARKALSANRRNVERGWEEWMNG